MKRLAAVMLAVAVVAMASFACKSKQPVAGTGAAADQAQEEARMAAEPKKFAEPTATGVDQSKKYRATIKTSKGQIVAELYPKEAPLSVTNFKQLADGGFYDGLTFHRVVPGFVVQGGDPTATGSGGPGYTILPEIGLLHRKGALAWARTGDAVNPGRRSSGSQFYITLEATPFLDGQYTVFGQTVSGMEVVEGIKAGDVIESVTVTAE